MRLILRTLRNKRLGQHRKVTPPGAVGLRRATTVQVLRAPRGVAAGRGDRAPAHHRRRKLGSGGRRARPGCTPTLRQSQAAGAPPRAAPHPAGPRPPHRGARSRARCRPGDERRRRVHCRLFPPGPPVCDSCPDVAKRYPLRVCISPRGPSRSGPCPRAVPRCWPARPAKPPRPRRPRSPTASRKPSQP